MRFQNKMRMVLDTDKKFGARVMTPEEIVELLNEQYETILELQGRIKAMDKPITQILLLLLDDEIKNKLSDVEWKAFEELSKLNGDVPMKPSSG